MKRIGNILCSMFVFFIVGSAFCCQWLGNLATQHGFDGIGATLIGWSDWFFNFPQVIEGFIGWLTHLNGQ